MYALIALGYTLVYGVLQLINFAHSEVFMFGAFGSYIVVHQIVGAGGHQNPVGVVGIIAIGLLSGALVSSCIAWLLERVAYRPLRRRGAPKLAFLISAIGASFFLVQLAGKLFNRFPGNAFPSYYQTDRRLFSIGTADVRVLQVMIIVTAVVTMFALDRGRLENQTRAQHPRVLRRTRRPRPSWASTSTRRSRAPSSSAERWPVSPASCSRRRSVFGNTMGFDPGVKAFAAAVLGGIGNIRGAMLGGLLLGLCEAVVPPPFPSIGIEWTDVVAFVVLVLVLIFRPTGLLGERLGRAA